MMQPGHSSYAQELQAGRSIVAQTVGDSMQPLLGEGRTAVVVQPLAGPLKRGDLPLYRRPDGQYVLHRIVRVKDGVYYTRGDNRYNEPERVEPDWVLGVVTQVVRGGRTIPVTDGSYCCYTALWLASYPLRHGMHQLRWHLKKALHREKKRP